jgi:hypothetical protein
MPVSTAMLAFIVLGLTAMLIQTQRAFKTGIKQATITDAGRTIIDMIATDLKQMSDAQNNNVVNFFWGWPLTNAVVNYENGVAIRTNALFEIYMLQHTNNAWVGVGYAVSNLLTPAGTPTGVGTLYRFETNWNDSAPSLPNGYASDYSCGAFFSTFSGATRFGTNYWHPVADGVIDLELRVFDQFGNENDSVWTNQWGYFAYPILPPGNSIVLPYTSMTINAPSTNTVPAYLFGNLPGSVELEFGILEPEAIAQARSLAVSQTALNNFLMTNAAPKIEVFRQRVTIAAASR